MNTQEFSNESPGQLVPVTMPWGPDHAFAPTPLPPNWVFPESLWPLLVDVKAEIALLEGIGRGLPNPTLLLKPLSGREAIQSSALEGTYATVQELLLFEKDPPNVAYDDEQTNDRREVANYRQALQYATSGNVALSLRLIREIHEILMRGVRGKEKTPGKFREKQVVIGSKGRFIPPPHFQLTECLDSLATYILDSTPSFNPLINCFLVHYQFETIHPFNDGNGRVGRLLLTLMLKHSCNLTNPWVYLSEFFNEHREEYVQLLYDVSAKGDWTSWIEFCLHGTLKQVKDTIRLCERLKLIKAEYLQRLQESPYHARLIQIVDSVFDKEFLDISDLKQLLGVTDPTARKDAERLVELGILAELPNFWPKTYYAPEVYRVAYDDID